MAKFVPCTTAEELLAAAMAGVLYRCFGGKAFLSFLNGEMLAPGAQLRAGDGTLGVLVEDDEDLQL